MCMTPIRRLLLVVCIAMSALALHAQTTDTTTTNKTTTQTTSEQQQVEEYSAPVTADTDKDANNPRALKLSLRDAIDPAMAQNIGVQVQRFDYREAGQSLREAYGPFDWFTTADIEHQSNQTPTISQFQASGRRQTL